MCAARAVMVVNKIDGVGTGAANDHRMGGAPAASVHRSRQSRPPYRARFSMSRRTTPVMPLQARSV